MFFLLTILFPGTYYVTHMATQLDLKMCSFYYNGERRGFPFQKLVNLHKGQHIIADGLMEYGYSGIDDNSKLCMLMNGINTNALDDCKASILAIPEMQGDFDIADKTLLP